MADSDPAPGQSGASEPEDEYRKLDTSRHDAFTLRRRREFLRALARFGCISDAAEEVGVAARTVYRHRDKDPAFAAHIALALEMAGTELELTAFQRGVIGVEVDVWHNGQRVGTTIKRSDAMLRLLLQGALPNKYGAPPGLGQARVADAKHQEMIERIRKAAHHWLAAKNETPLPVDSVRHS